MQFIDLKAQFKGIEQEIRARIDAVLEHGNFILGPEIRELESKLAAMAGARHCITCASGTDALLMPMMAWGIGPGDAVFVPAFTFFATAEVVSLLGATPVFVDIGQDYNIVPELLEKAIAAVLAQDPSIYPLPATAMAQKLTPKVVIPVDMFGIAADYPAIAEIASKHELLVIEDAAQSFGGSRFGLPVCGQKAHCAGTSFFPAKPLGCYGDGGAIFTNDDTLAEQLKSIRVHGKGAHKYENIRIGLNARMDTLQAAIMLPKVDILPSEIAMRQKVASGYAARLGRIEGVTAPAAPLGCVSAWAQYTVRIAAGKRDAVAASLQQKGVPTAVYYPMPLHVQKAYADLKYLESDMPTAAALCREVLSLPFHPYLPESDQDFVCAALAESLKEAGL